MPATPSRPATPWRPIAPWRPATPWRERGPVRAADWPAAREAARLLTYLGADTVPASSSSPALMQGGRSVPGASTTVDQDWAASGAAALTGWPDAPPVAPAGQPATVARAVALAFELITGVAVDGPALLGERAALMGLARNGRTAPGGATRLMSAADGWWALNLARDLDLVPALLETGDVDSINLAEPWCSITAWASRRRVTTIIERATLLGLAVAALGETGLDGPPWRITHRLARTPGRPRPLVANLGALWAGPLAAQLLRRSGADVIDIESRTRRPSRTCCSRPTSSSRPAAPVHSETSASTPRPFSPTDTPAPGYASPDIGIPTGSPSATTPRSPGPLSHGTSTTNPSSPATPSPTPSPDYWPPSPSSPTTIRPAPRSSISR
jgi:hypothetical protein